MSQCCFFYCPQSFKHHPALSPEEYCEQGGSHTHENLYAGHGIFNSSHDLFDNYTMLNGTHGGEREGGGDHHMIAQPNTAFKTFIIQYFTYVIAMYLKLFKTHHALGKTVSLKRERKPHLLH